MVRALRVLIADDEKDTREFLGHLVTRLGHQVVTAADGRQLAELAKVSEPDLVITDIKMPEVDGIEAAAQINRLRETPVILVTGHHQKEFLGRAAANNVLAYLIKPVKPEDVESAIEVAMARFEEYRGAKKEAADLRHALEERKLIERAKGAVMRRTGLEEQEAFRRLKKVAGDSKRKVVEVAREIVAADEVFQQIDRV